MIKSKLINCLDSFYSIIITPFSETVGGGIDVNDAAWSATVAPASASTLPVAASEQLFAVPSNSGSRSGGPSGSAAAPTSSDAIGKPRSGGGDDLTAEITAKCFAGMSSGKVFDGSVELQLSGWVASRMFSSLPRWLRPSNKPTRCPVCTPLYYMTFSSWQLPKRQTSI